MVSLADYINQGNVNQQAAVSLYGGVVADPNVNNPQGYVIYYDSTGSLKCAYVTEGGYMRMGGTPQGYGEYNNINTSYGCHGATFSGLINSDQIDNIDNVEIAGVDEVFAFKAVANKLKLEKTNKNVSGFIEKINKSVFAENYITDADDPDEFPWLCREWVGGHGVGNPDAVPVGEPGHWRYFFCNVSVKVRL